jgi:hypothetical protein
MARLPVASLTRSTIAVIPQLEQNCSGMPPHSALRIAASILRHQSVESVELRTQSDLLLMRRPDG